jgi:hypothetical protein
MNVIWITIFVTIAIIAGIAIAIRRKEFGLGMIVVVSCLILTAFLIYLPKNGTPIRKLPECDIHLAQILHVDDENVLIVFGSDQKIRKIPLLKFDEPEQLADIAEWVEILVYEVNGKKVLQILEEYTLDPDTDVSGSFFELLPAGRQDHSIND